MEYIGRPIRMSPAEEGLFLLAVFVIFVSYGGFLGFLIWTQVFLIGRWIEKANIPVPESARDKD